MKKVALIVALSIAVYHLAQKMYEYDPQGTFNLLFIIALQLSVFSLGAFLGANMPSIERFFARIKSYKLPSTRRRETEEHLRDLALVQRHLVNKDMELREVAEGEYMLLKRQNKQKFAKVQIGEDAAQVVLMTHTGLINNCDKFTIAEIKQIVKA